MKCTIHYLGLVDYDEVYLLQKRLIQQRADNKIQDTLLLLEHTPTITIGKSGKLENVLVSQEFLARENISLLFVDRGGDVTYHGPGQLVAYPIIDLRQRGKDLHRYIRDLEEVIIMTLTNFSIKASRDESHPGVWVEGKAIAAIGIKMMSWVTMHGLALNINPELEHFSLINPCGFPNIRVTSMSKLLAQDVPMEPVIATFQKKFSEVFSVCIEMSSKSLIKY